MVKLSITLPFATDNYQTCFSFLHILLTEHLPFSENVEVQELLFILPQELDNYLGYFCS